VVFDKGRANGPGHRHPSCSAFMRELLDAVLELGKDDRREMLGLLRMSGDAPLPAILSTSFDETMMVPRTESRRANWPWFAAVALAVLLGAGWFFLKGPRGTRLQINSIPTGARVFLNDLAVGSAPLNQPLVPGDRLRLELKGHQPTLWEFKAGEAPPAFPLQPLVTEELLDSTPQGATVVMDEKALEGLTPLKVRWDQGQAHRLTFTKDRLGAALDFGPGEVPGGRAFELKEASSAETRPEPPLDPSAPGLLRLAGGFGVRLKVDGKDLGELSPGSTLSLPPGSHRIELSSPRRFFRGPAATTIFAGQSATLSVPGLATLTFENYPGTGKVYVDGLDTGIESDGSSVVLAQGRHTVSVRGPKGTKTEMVELSGDKSLRFQL